METLNFKISSYCNSYFDSLLEIDTNSSGKYTWEPDHLFETLKNKNVTCVVATDNLPLGFCIYSTENTNYIDILHLVVNKPDQRQGIGTCLINKVKSKITKKRNYLNFDVLERNLSTQFFLKTQDFKAKLVRTGMEDIYRFTYEVAK